MVLSLTAHVDLYLLIYKDMPTDKQKACVLDELRKISATGFVANGASIRDVRPED